MDFSADYIKARKLLEDMAPPSPEAIEALGGMPIGQEISTITGKPIDKGMPAPAGETVPSHETPEDSAWDTIVKGFQALPGVMKQAAGGALQAGAEHKYYGGIEGIVPEAPEPGGFPAVEKKGRELAESGRRDVMATLPRVPKGSFKAHLYGAIQSTGLNLGAIGIGVATGSPTIPLLLLSAISGGADYAENRAAGVPSETAWIGMIANAAAEYAGEMLPIHAYLKKGAPLMRRVLTGALLELPGEMGTQIVQSAEEKLTRNPGMTWEEFLETMQDTAIQTLIATTITGGVVGAGGATVSAARGTSEEGGKPEVAPPEFTEESIKAQAEELGVEFRGFQNDFEGKPAFGMMHDPTTKSAFAARPGETVEQGLNRVRGKFGLGPAVTLARVQAAFPGTDVVKDGEAFTISTPSGTIRILPDQTIELDPSTGVQLEQGEAIVGEFTKIDKGGIIRLAKEGADETTLPHETFHAAVAMALSPQERTAVLEAYRAEGMTDRQAEESAAEAYAEWSPKLSNPLFQKVRDFFARVREMLFGPTSAGTMEKIRSGEVWGRGIPSEARQTSYQVRRAAPIFFSQAKAIVEGQKFPDKIKAQSVRNLLAKNGAKAEELSWLGVDDFLAGKDRVSREELLDFIDQNTVRVEEVPTQGIPAGSAELLMSKPVLSGAGTEGEVVFRVRVSSHLGEDGGRTLSVDDLGVLGNSFKPNGPRELANDIFGRKMAAMMPLDEMDYGVLAALQYDQIRQAVISRLPVDVVNYLRSIKFSPEDLFRNADVLVKNLPIDHLRSVANGILAGARDVGASLRAKLLAASAAGRDANLLPALKASELDTRVVMGLLAPESLYHVGLSFLPGGSDVAGPRAVEPGSLSGLRGVDLERLAADHAYFLDTVVPASEGAVFEGGVSGSDRENSSARLASYLDWHRNILARAGVSRQVPTAPSSALKAVLRYAASRGYNEISWLPMGKSTEATILGFAKKYGTGVRLDKASNGATVHALPITTAMAADVITKGQPLYQKKKSGRFPGEPAGKGYTFNSNDPEGVKNVGRAFLLDVWNDIEFTQKNVETAARAQELLDKGIVTVEEILNTPTHTPFQNAETMVAADRLRFGIYRKFSQDLIPSFKKGELSWEEFRSAMAIASGLTAKIQSGISQGARVLQARQVAFEGFEPGAREWTDAVANAFDNLGQLQGREGLPVDYIIDMIEALPEPGEMLPKLPEITAKDMFIEAWYGSLLSNPVTHAANFIGNTVAMFAAIPTRGIASLSHRIAGKGEGVVPGEIYAMLYGMTQGFTEALRAAGSTAWTGETAFGREKMERRVRAPAVTAANLNASGAIGYAIDLLGMVIRGPGRALLSSDEFFKVVNYRMEVHAQAYRQAAAEGWTGEELARRMAEIIANPPDSIHALASDWANYQTFTNPLGKLGQAIMQVSNAHPAVKLVLPFVATPTNILKYTFERVGPLSYALKSTREDVAAGGSRRDLAIARMALGSMVMASAATLAAGGLITGGGPSDPKMREAKRRTGWQPYSIKVGGKYYSYSRLEPFATLFGMVTDAIEIMGQRTEREVETVAKALILSFSKNMTSKTYLTGLSDALEAINDPDKGGDRFIRRLIGSVIPAGVAQVRRIADPQMREMRGPTPRSGDSPIIREAKTIISVLRNRTPGYSKDLPPRRNLWGDTIVLEGALGPDIISPIYQSEIKDSPVDEELLRLEVGLTMPPRYVFGYRPPEGVPMEDDRVRSGIPLTAKEYDFFVQVAAGKSVEVEGVEYRVADQTLKEALLERIRDPEYGSLSDGPEGGKALSIRVIVAAYRDTARAMLLEASPQLMELYEEKIQERAVALGGE